MERKRKQKEEEEEQIERRKRTALGFPIWKNEINTRREKRALPSSCMRNYREEKRIGKGTDGEVYSVCDERNDNCNLALKVVKWDEGPEEDLDFKEESEYSYLMGLHGIGPRIYDYWKGNKIYSGRDFTTGGFLVEEKLDMTLDEYRKMQIKKIRAMPEREYIEVYLDQLKKIQDIILEKLQRMSEISYNGKYYVMCDMHPNNIMVNVNKYPPSYIDRVTSAFIIDFGTLCNMSALDETIKETRNIFLKMFTDHELYYFPSEERLREFIQWQ